MLLGEAKYYFLAGLLECRVLLLAAILSSFGVDLSLWAIVGLLICPMMACKYVH